jgi:hypothetical protein
MLCYLFFSSLSLLNHRVHSIQYFLLLLKKHIFMDPNDYPSVGDENNQQSTSRKYISHFQSLSQTM